MPWNISLKGEWNFSLGDLDSRITTDKIVLPGILQAQGYGNEVDYHTPWVSSLHDRLWYEREEYKTHGEEILVPFLSQPPKHYLGKAWYRKSFIIPADCEEEYFVFHMECVKWRTTCYIDGRLVGEEEGLCTPHEYRLGQLEAGEHTLTVCVDNSLLHPYRPDGHMVSDALGATWNGIVGDIYIKGYKELYIEEIGLYPDSEKSQVEVKISFLNYSEESKAALLHLDDEIIEVAAGSGQTEFMFTVPFKEEISLWDEYSPTLYEMKVKLKTENGEEERKVSYGFRSIKVEDGLFYLNNRPAYFRGTHMGGEFPLTGYPSTKTEDWERIFRICKDWGLNYIRFHSYCPPRAAFIAADYVGIYLQIECGMWNIFSEGNGMEEILWSETQKILNTYGNHPSFLMLSPSNEPGGNWFSPLAKWVDRCKQYDNRRIYASQSGWPYPMEPKDIYGTDYVYFHRSGYGITPGGTIRNFKGWHGKDYLPSVEGIKYPVISHELGQWCSYPDFDVIDKFTGYLKPGNYKVFKENAKRKGVLSQNKEFAYLSGKLKAILYKEELEANFRTPHLYGFELLDLHDYIGQGSALVGMLDTFWEEKGFVTKEEFRQFCSETVPLLRIEKRLFTADEIFDYPLEFCHFGREKIKDADIYCHVTDEDGKVLVKKELKGITLSLAKNINIGRITFSLNEFAPSKEYKITIGIAGSQIKNSWNFFVFDSQTEDKNINAHKKDDNLPENILYTNSLTFAMKHLEEGRKVLYSPNPNHHRLESPPCKFLPSFWNSQMGPTYKRGMGLVIQNTHKALSLFPTKEYADWQWEDIMNLSCGLNMDKLPKELMPIVQPIDDWSRNYKLGMVLECKVNKGSLLICTADIENSLEKRPAARQLRKSLIEYMASEEFAPVVKVSPNMLYDSFFPRTVMKAYEVEVEEEFECIIDGEPNTFYQKENAYPLTITMKMPREALIKGLIYMPRQNEREHKGDIKGLRVEAMLGESYEVIYEGELPSSFEPKEILFGREISAREIKVIALYGFSGKDISVFTYDFYGWHQKKIDYEDTSAAIGDLLFIPVHKDFDYVGTSEKIEVELKSATKEIDN